MKTYTFNVEGMTCHACESLITMDLEDAGLPAPQSVSADNGQVVMEIAEEQKDAVIAAIQSSGKYTVTGVTE